MATANSSATPYPDDKPANADWVKVLDEWSRVSHELSAAIDALCRMRVGMQRLLLLIGEEADADEQVH